MKTIRFLTVIGVIAIIFSACSGKDGALGATGPQGPAGNANVYSNIYTAYTNNQTNPQSGLYKASFTDAAINNAAADGIEMFVSLDNSNFFGLPDADLLVGGDDMEFSITNGGGSIIYLNSSAPSVTLYFKVVVIPPALMKKHPNTNWHDYGQVNAIIGTQSTVKN